MVVHCCVYGLDAAGVAEILDGGVNAWAHHILAASYMHNSYTVVIVESYAMIIYDVIMIVKGNQLTGLP